MTGRRARTIYFLVKMLQRAQGSGYDMPTFIQQLPEPFRSESPSQTGFTEEELNTLIERYRNGERLTPAQIVEVITSIESQAVVDAGAYFADELRKLQEWSKVKSYVQGMTACFGEEKIATILSWFPELKTHQRQ